MDLVTEAGALSEDLVTLRRRLHRIPEIGFELPKTQEVILTEIDGLGLEVSTGRALTSVTAVLRGGAHGGNGPVVLLRGDMDALPVTEHTGVDFASEHDGVMHACGHDLHMAGLVGAVRLLAAHRAELPGDVVFMFQPGEEGYDGAGAMLAEGILDAAGRPVDAACGLHVFSSIFPTGTFAGRPGPLMASSAGLRVRVIGAGSHGSMPHLGRDPIPAACEMVTALQTAVTRQFYVFDPVVITVGQFHAGTKRNVIGDEAMFDATVRTFGPSTQDKVRDVATRLCTDIAAAHGLTAEVEFIPEYPLTANDPAEYDFAAATAADLFGAGRIELMPQPMAGAEDFSRVLEAVPGAYLFLGACTTGDVGTAASNHSPLATFDDAVLPDAAAMLAELAVRRLNRADHAAAPDGTAR